MILKIVDKNNKTIWIIIILFLSLVVTLFCQYPILKNKYIIQGDVRQNIFWMEKFRDPELFKDDIYLRYSAWFTPIGVKSFYFLTSFFSEPVIVTKLLPFILCPLAALYFFGIGKFIRNQRAGILLAFLFILLAFYKGLAYFEDGCAGDFSSVVLVIFLYYFIRKDYLKAGLAIVLQAIFYPPFCAVSFFSYAISFIKYRQGLFSFEKDRRKLIYFVTALIICISILASKYLFCSQEFGKVLTITQLKSMPEFYKKEIYGGDDPPRVKTPYFFSSVLERLTNDMDGITLNYSTSLLFGISIILLILLRKKALRLPKELWYFIVSSWALYILSNKIMLILYEPSRYVRMPFPVFLIIFNAVNFDILIHSIKKNIHRRAVLLIFVTCILIFYLLNINRYHYIATDKKLYSFLSSLPKDILVAGHPENMNYIPTYAKRKTFLIEELLIPYFQKYYNEMKKKTYDFFDAYYATSGEQVYAFCKRNGITHFVVYKSHFSEDYLHDKIFYYSPFNDWIINLINKRDKKHFILNNIADNKKLLIDKDYFVISCNKETLCNEK